MQTGKGGVIAMKTKGFALVEVLIAAIIIGIIASISVPAVINSGDKAKAEICVRHLKSIDNAKIQWAVDNNVLDSATPEISQLLNYVIGNLPTTCTVAKVGYDIGDVITPASCSYHGNSQGNAPLHYKEEGYVFNPNSLAWQRENNDVVGGIAFPIIIVGPSTTMYLLMVRLQPIFSAVLSTNGDMNGDSVIDDNEALLLIIVNRLTTRRPTLMVIIRTVKLLKSMGLI